MKLDPDGAERFASALSPSQLVELAEALATVPADRPGVRLTGVAGLKSLLDIGGPIGGLAAGLLGVSAQPVRAVLFDKSAQTNWSLAWHQDRTIAVQSRREVAGFGPWSVKDGLQHVEPPFEIIERMATLRVHLDPVGNDNAPLLVLPGSHRLGRLTHDRMTALAAGVQSATCLAAPGDVWLYATPIVHASEAAHVPKRRRVLQIDYSAERLPAGLAWLGV